MGATKQIEPQSPTAVHNGAWQRYDNALQTLACRALGEPYNFYRVDAAICPEMFGSSVFGVILASCQRQFRQDGRYSIHSVADETKILVGTLAEFSRRDAEIDLPYAFDIFRDIYGQFVEIQIADFISGWVHQGKTSEEIKIEAEKMRREKGVLPRATGSDGKEEFEAMLFAALDGKEFDYPVKPHLSSMRKAVPFYEPGDYVVVTALSGVGKTYYALNTIYHNAISGVPCCCINLENTPANMQKRIWQIHGGQKFSRAAMKHYTDEKIFEATRAWEDVKKMPFSSLNPGRSLPSILSAIRHEYTERGIQLAVIDYAQLISIPGYKGGRNYELGEVSAELRALALELPIVVMVLAQLKQEVSKYADRRGGLYDIKDCANFAQDATFVHSLYRPYTQEVYSDPSGNEYSPNYADVWTVKGRETGKLEAVCEFDEIRGFCDSAAKIDFSPPVDFTIPASALKISRANEEDIPF